MQTVPPITLTNSQRKTLRLWLRLGASRRLALRARIVLLAAAGEANRDITRQLRTSSKTVALWRRRFLQAGLLGIEKEASRRPRESKAHEAMVRLILRRTTQPPPAGAARWTTRSLAKELGISPSRVQRVWKAHGVISGRG